jgi:hypothetical protein
VCPLEKKLSCSHKEDDIGAQGQRQHRGMTASTATAEAVVNRFLLSSSAIPQHEDFFGKVIESFLETAASSVQFVHQILLRHSRLGPVLIEFGDPSLEKGCQNPRTTRIFHVRHKTQVEKAGNSLLQCFHAADEGLPLHDKIKDHFPAKRL